jgi:5-methylthioadenosine/S-adenosylhomocysteine deaminase
MHETGLTPPISSPQRASTPLLLQRVALLSPVEPSGLVPDQDILIIDQYIRAIGPTGTLALGNVEDMTVIAAQGQMAIPGLINAHTHSTDNLLKAASPSLPLELWLVPLFSVIEEWTPRMVYLSALLGAIEMLKGGTTAVLDHLWIPAGATAPYMDAAMQAYADAGIRAAVAPYIEDQDLVQDAAIAHGLTLPTHPFVNRLASFPTIDVQLRELERFFATWHKAAGGRLRCLVGPSGIHWCSDSLLQKCLLLAERYQTGIHLHAVETALQASVIRSALGHGGIAHLEALGLLRAGTSLAHAIWLEENDLERLARSGATVVHNPVSNLRLGSGQFPLIAARQQGVSVALGSDGSSCNDTQNMFGVLKLTGLMHNHPGTDHQQWPGAAEILDAATQGGADALGMAGELGKLAPGQLADVVLLDLRSPAFIPLHDPYLHLVYCETGNSVKTVIVDGKMQIEHGKIVSVDEEVLRQEMLERCSTLWPGFPMQRDRVAHTGEIMATFDVLSRLLLNEGKSHKSGSQ